MRGQSSSRLTSLLDVSSFSCSLGPFLGKNSLKSEFFLIILSYRKLTISFISAENFWIQGKSIRNRFRMANIWIISDDPKCFPRLYRELGCTHSAMDFHSTIRDHHSFTVVSFAVMWSTPDVGENSF